MPLIPWIEDAEATGLVAEVYGRWKRANPDREKVPGILKCLSSRPDLLEGVFELSYPLLFSDGFLTRRVKEMLATYVSALNECPYCAGSHAYFLSVQEGQPLADSLKRLDLETPLITDAERALLRFARLVTLEGNRNSPGEIARLHELGWVDNQISEAVYVTALYAFFNRVANAYGLEDPQYHLTLKRNEAAG